MIISQSNSVSIVSMVIPVVVGVVAAVVVMVMVLFVLFYIRYSSLYSDILQNQSEKRYHYGIHQNLGGGPSLSSLRNVLMTHNPNFLTPHSPTPHTPLLSNQPSPCTNTNQLL